MNKGKQKLLIGIFISIVVIIFISYVFLEKEETVYYSDNLEEEVTTTISDYFYVDVKGAVKTPGVYEFKNGERVIDAINKAGGITKEGNTSNVNLSKKLTSEMVVYIYTNKEIKDGSKAINCDTNCNCETLDINNCYEELKQEERMTSKININTATIKELITLNGIGDSKAQNIITYREENGLFKTIEDIENVSGIGDTIFINIKDQITV